MNSIKQIERLGEAPVHKLLFEFSWPAIIGFVAVAFYETIDRIFVGQVVGSSGLAVMAVGMPVVITINAFCIMFRAGIAALFSHTLGHGNYELINKFVTNLLFLAFLIGLFLAGVLGYFSEEIAILCAATPEAMHDSSSYITLIALGSIGLFVGNAANVLMRALGKPRQGMFLIVGSAVMNVLLDIVFVVYLNYGVAGAALGTMLSQIAGGIYGVCYLRKYLKINCSIFEFSIMKRCCQLGAPLAVFEINYMACALVLNHLLSSYGTENDLAAIPVFSSILSILFMPIAGLDEGAQILIGYNYAAGKLCRVRKVIIQVLGVGIGFYICSFLLLQVATEYIVMAFNAEDPVFILHTARICRIIFAVAPVMAIMHIVPGILTALGEVKYCFTLSVVLEILLQYPPLFILPLFLGVDGVFAAFPLYDLLFAFAALILLYKSIRKKQI